MTIPFLSRFCCYLMIFLASCLGGNERPKAIVPLSMSVTNPRIERLDPDRDEFYEWKADAVFVNNSIDTIYVDRTMGNEFILFDVKYYIVDCKNVYIGGKDNFIESVSDLYKMVPGESISSIIFFALSEDYVNMDELYISIRTEYSSTRPPHDSLVGHHASSGMIKNVLYRPTIKFHINSKLNTPEEIDINIDSLIKIKGYNAIRVGF